MFLPEKKTRKPFKTSTKKTEWILATGKNPSSGKFVKMSKCRECGMPLTWGDRKYDFDHKDNNPANNSQSNCYLVCKSCHGNATLITKRKRKALGQTIGYETVKRKVGYKKSRKKTRNTKRVPIHGVFGEITGYRTVKIRKPKAVKSRKRKRKARKK